MEEQNDAPSLMEELAQERRKREELERRVNDLVAAAEAAERSAQIRTELQKLGVTKVDLAYRAVKDELAAAPVEQIREHLAKFVAENPELMPARIPGGSGASTGPRTSAPGSGVDLDKIRPGMSAEEMERVRQEIARVASQTLRGGW